jgi:serine O-acetyltransferase
MSDPRTHASRMTDPAGDALPRATTSLRGLVAADLWRCAGRTGWRAFLSTWVTDPPFRPVFTLRLCQALRSRHASWSSCLLAFVMFWHRRNQFRCGVDLPSSLVAGPGLKLLHGWGCVINRDTRIGTNVLIMQGGTVGGTGTGTPTINDDVIIYATTTVVGGIRLGHGSVVGAGAVVVCDVPAGCSAVGSPARILQRAAPPKGYHPLPEHLR